MSVGVKYSTNDANEPQVAFSYTFTPPHVLTTSSFGKPPDTFQMTHRHRSLSSSSSSSISSGYSSDSMQDYQALRRASTMPISMAQTSPIQATLPPFSTLYLTIHSAQNVQFKSNRAYCKTFVANMPMVENTMFAHFSNNQFQSFKTDIVQVDNNNPVWNAKYEIRINDPKVEVLSILVKDQQLLCCAIVGVCIINLKILIDAGHVDQWFALRKGQFQTGHLRLQMQLKKVEQPSKFGRTRISSDQSLFDRINRVESIYDDRCRRHGERHLREVEHHPRKQHRHHNNGKHQQTDDLNSSDKIDKSPEAVNEAFTSSLDQVRLTSDYEEGSLKTVSERNPIKNNYPDLKSSDIGENKPESELSDSSSSTHRANQQHKKHYGKGTSKGIKKKTNKYYSDSESSSRSSSSSDSRQRHRKHKKRHSHRHHKHHTHQPFTTGPYATQPTYTSTPIGVLPPPQAPSHGKGMDQLVNVASRVASIALLGADITKAFSKPSNPPTVIDATANQGIPIASERQL